MKRIAILGSTGSIGCSALSVVDAYPDRLDVVALAAGTNVPRFTNQVERYRPQVIGMASASALEQTKGALRAAGFAAFDQAGFGTSGLTAVATHPDVELVLCASAGTAALEAVLSAIEAGKTIALANKEILVMAGRLVMAAARTHGVTILPVDSEHNAIHQCLHRRQPDEVKRLILTASGGPFRDWTAGALEGVTPQAALDHPTWNMGRKITIDSATLMNKGLEVIEARWLFDVTPDQVAVVVHPQSIVHSLVELRDGSLIAQLGITDMRLPIQYAFSYPDRWDSDLPALNLAQCGRLDFDTPDLARFPCLALAYRVLHDGGALSVVLNAANEVAVEAFLAGRIAFTAIPTVIEQALEAAASGRDVPKEADTLATVRDIDTWTRKFSGKLTGEVESK